MPPNSGSDSEPTTKNGIRRRHYITASTAALALGTTGCLGTESIPRSSPASVPAGQQQPASQSGVGYGQQGYGEGSYGGGTSTSTPTGVIARYDEDDSGTIDNRELLAALSDYANEVSPSDLLELLAVYEADN